MPFLYVHVNKNGQKAKAIVILSRWDLHLWLMSLNGVKLYNIIYFIVHVIDFGARPKYFLNGQ